ATDVQITELVSKLGKLCVIARTFAHGSLDGWHIRHLRSDVEMKQLEAVRQPGILQHLTRSNQIGGVETEFGVLAAARRPFACAFAIQTSTNTNVGFAVDLLRCANDLLQLFEFFRDDNDRLAKLAAKQCNANKSGIFIAVADDQALRVFLHGKRGNQFRLAACFEPKVKLFARIDNFLDDLAQLIDFDGKNAAILIEITEFSDRALKCAIDRFNAVPEQILKSNQQWKTKVSGARLIDYCQEIDGTAAIL